MSGVIPGLIRRMASADVAEVLCIEQTVQAYPWTQGHFDSALAYGNACYVYERDAKIVAYAVLLRGVDEMELLTIGVAVACQRQGVGRALLSALLGDVWQQGLQRMFLEVRVSNAPAIALYHHLGFVQVGMRKAYYQNAQGREDALVMCCEDRKNEA